MKQIDIEMEIRQTVQLFGKTSKGWESCVHTTCDHGKKGPRAAFLFSHDKITFNCFNCGTSAVLDLEQAQSLPAKFREILTDFGMSKHTLDMINFQLLQKNSKAVVKKNGKVVKPVSINPKPITLPRDFVMLEGNENTSVGKMALAELERRKINYQDYPFMLCIKGSTKQREKWSNRLVIPFFKGDDLIFYQAQDLTKESETKYLNAPDKCIDRTKILSNYDEIKKKSNLPIYVVEGFYDSYHLNGVAIFGNRVKDHQQTWLNRSYREKIYIPDRSGDASEVARWCLKNGWKISVPYTNLQSNIKDVSDMISAYGKLYTIKAIQENTSTSDLDGEIKIGWLTK